MLTSTQIKAGAPPLHFRFLFAMAALSATPPSRRAHPDIALAIATVQQLRVTRPASLQHNTAGLSDGALAQECGR